MQDDIFDTYDTSDIPKELSSQLSMNSFRNGSSFSGQIFYLFKEANRELSIDQVTVAYYRRYKHAIPRKSIMAKLYTMSKAGILRKLADHTPLSYVLSPEAEIMRQLGDKS